MTIAARPNGDQRRGTEAGLTANETKFDLLVSQQLGLTNMTE